MRPCSGEARLRVRQSGANSANHLGVVGGSGVDREAASAAADVTRGSPISNPRPHASWRNKRRWWHRLWGENSGRNASP
jgi:hypothetical protein